MADSTGLPIASVVLRHEQDVVAARRHAREVAAALGLDNHDQARVAAAVSELARQAHRGAGASAAVRFGVAASRRFLEVRVGPFPPAITNLASRAPEDQANADALVAARRVVDAVEVVPAGDGVEVVLSREIPHTHLPIDAARLAQVATRLTSEPSSALLEEVQRQNQDLLRVLQTLRERQDELQQVNHELEDTNRGVLALYAELDERTEGLRRASELKTRFLRHMTHEFRTPLHSILAIARLLKERTDGDLTLEQARQVTLIERAAEDLSELVNDLLDLAKVEAGRVEVRPGAFDVHDLFGAIRGMMRPLVVHDTVRLSFDAPNDLSVMNTDEGKLSQILRNLVANAVKFTDAGHVTIAARHDAARQAMVFTVTDTGIGIAPEDQARIFVEFSQLDHPIQRKVRGTGLGLPLSRRLAELLGGSLEVQSQQGVGSVFTLTLPLVYEAGPRVPAPGPARLSRVLVVDDDEPWRYVVRRALDGLADEVAEAGTGEDALRLAREGRPDVIVLDLVMPGMDGWNTIEALRHDTVLADVPIVVVTQQVPDAGRCGVLEGCGVTVLAKASVWPNLELLVSAVRRSAEARPGSPTASRGGGKA